MIGCRIGKKTWEDSTPKAFHSAKTAPPPCGPTDSTPLGGEIEIEDGALHLRILLDQSALEIFANGTPLAARVYPTRDDATAMRLAAVRGETLVQRFDVWEMAAAAPHSDASLSLTTER